MGHEMRDALAECRAINADSNAYLAWLRAKRDGSSAAKVARLRAEYERLQAISDALRTK